MSIFSDMNDHLHLSSVAQFLAEGDGCVKINADTFSERLIHADDAFFDRLMENFHDEAMCEQIYDACYDHLCEMLNLGYEVGTLCGAELIYMLLRENDAQLDDFLHFLRTWKKE